MTSTLQSFYQGKRVFITGHTGFKGSWLCLWLHSMGATVMGYALSPPTKPSLYELCRVDELVNSIIADVRDFDTLSKAMVEAKPEIVIHMAAQPLVRDSYKNPVETYAINVMGTVHLLEAVRACQSVKAVINVTTDKVYENRERVWGYRENEPLGGYDPYSSSKACSELVTAAYRSSFFNPSTAIASARAGNVIGGGDWGKDRLIEDGARFADAWNFGPEEQDARDVGRVVARLCEKWGSGASYIIDEGEYPHEATCLRLDCSKVRALLNWCSIWNIDTAIDAIVSWTKAYRDGMDVRQVCLKQIDEYEASRFH